MKTTRRQDVKAGGEACFIRARLDQQDLQIEKEKQRRIENAKAVLSGRPLFSSGFVSESGKDTKAVFGLID
jgi:hypothetical protein